MFCNDAKHLCYFSILTQIFCTITRKFPGKHESWATLFKISRYISLFMQTFHVKSWNNLVITWKFATFRAIPLKSRVVIYNFRVITRNICISSRKNLRYLAKIRIFREKLSVIIQFFLWKFELLSTRFVLLSTCLCHFSNFLAALSEFHVTSLNLC